MARLSFRTDDANGFIHHVEDSGMSNNINDRSGRVQIRWQPDKKLTVDLLGEYSMSQTDGTTPIVTGCSDSNYFTSGFNSLHSQNYCAMYPILTGKNEVYGGAT